MAIPAAIVSVQLTRLVGIPAALLAGTNQVYVVTRIGSRQFGRTTLIPSGATDYAIGRSLSVPVVSGQTITIEVAIWNDREDLAPVQLWSATHDILPPWTSGALNFGAAPRLEGRILTDTILAGSAPVAAPRVGTGAPRVGVTVSPRRTFTVELTEVLGLYEPGHTPVGLARPVMRAEHHAGYTSADNRGRIFLNRDLTGAWAHDVQLIQATARVHVSSGALPAGSRIRWRVIDPDDPFNEDPRIHRQWGKYLDANDFSGTTPIGAHESDNEGTPDRNPRWEVVTGGYALTVTSPTEAFTSIVASESKVKIHCPNVAGDNMIVQAELDPAPAAALGRSFPASTGIMTMWNRIDVEYIKMTTALDLPVADVPPVMEPACIQLDFQPVRVVADRLNMAPDKDQLTTESVAYANANFSHAGTPGWFCLIAAMMPHSVSIVPDLFTGNVTLHTHSSGATFRASALVPGRFPSVGVIEFSWAGNTITFDVVSRNLGSAHTRCFLRTHDIQDLFTAGDGSVDHAYAISLDFYPTVRIEGTTQTSGGYSMPSPVHAVVKPNAGLYTAGISPFVVVSGQQFFAGRTIIFTHHHRAFRDRVTGSPLPEFHDGVIRTIAHELSHAFGMPHKCGYFDFETPRDKSCFMNYRVHWMINPATRELMPGTSENVGPRFCGRHLKELRRTHIEDNGGLGW